MTLVKNGLDSLSPTELARCSFQSDAEGNELIYVCKDCDFLKEIEYLKSKVDAGADLIITQMFFDCKVFDSFVTCCRNAGINVPIIPGIMCLSSYGGFQRMTSICKTRVTKELTEEIEKVKNNDDEFKVFGVNLGIKMCNSLINSKVPGLHFYTLNSSVSTLEIINSIGLSRM